MFQKKTIIDTSKRENEEFIETGSNLKIKNYTNQFTLLKSKLPNKLAFRMGANGLKYKKFRLIFTILLSLISFTLFAIADSLASYNEVDAITNSSIDSGVNYASFSKEETKELTSGNRTYNTVIKKRLLDNDILYLNEKLGLGFKPVIKEIDQYNLNNNFINEVEASFYYGWLSGFISMDLDEIENLGFTLTGRLPVAKNEIVITKHLFEFFQERGYYYVVPYDVENDTKEYEIRLEGSQITSEYDMINKNIILPTSYDKPDEKFTITGILDTNFDSSRYESLKTPGSQAISLLESEYRNLMDYGYHQIAIVSNDYIDDKIDYYSNFLNLRDGFEYAIQVTRNNETFFYSFERGCKQNITGLNQIFFKNTQKTLNNNEILISFERFINEILSGVKFVYNDEEMYYGDIENILINDAVLAYATENYQTAKAKGFYQSNDAWQGQGPRFSEQDKINLYQEYLLKKYPINEFGNITYDNLKNEEIEYYRQGFYYNEVQLMTNAIKDYATDNYLIAEANGFYYSGDYWGPDPAFASIEDKIAGYENYLNSHHSTNKYGDKSYTEIREDVISTFEKPFYDDEANIMRQKTYDYATINCHIVESQGFYTSEHVSIDRINEDELIFTYKDYIYSDHRINKYGDKTYFDIFQDVFTNQIVPIIQTSVPKSFDIFVGDSYESDLPKSKVTIAGIFIPIDTNDWKMSQSLILSDDEFNELKEKTNSGIYSHAIANMSNDRMVVKKVAEFTTNFHHGNITYKLENQVTPTLDMANGIVEDVAKVSLYIGIGFAVFAALMLSNFIASSVTRQKREIGILRALGARSNDVFKIFFNESFIIAMINFILSAIVSFAVIMYINIMLRNSAGLQITIFTFGVRQILLLLIISVFVSIFASFFPVQSIARKHPVDAISNK